MTVNELIAKLSKVEDKNLEVLVGDNDGWRYETFAVRLEKVRDGRTKEDGELCVVVD